MLISNSMGFVRASVSGMGNLVRPSRYFFMVINVILGVNNIKSL